MKDLKGYFNHYKVELEVKRLPTDVWGLKYKPSVEPVWSDVVDYYKEWGSKSCGHEIVGVDREFIIDFMNKYKNQFKVIVEIGVCRKDLENSWTGYFLSLKNKDCFYIGVDRHPKDFLNNSENRVFTIHTESQQINKVMDFIEEITGKKEIDLLFIDGLHSIDMACNDWRYAQYLSKGGIVLFHDISIHPSGLVFDAIDEDLFEKRKIFLHHPDSSGMGIAMRKAFKSCTRPAIDFMSKHFSNKPVVGAELGVFRGDNALRLFNMLNIQMLHLVDIWVVGKYGLELDCEAVALARFKNVANAKIYKGYTYDVVKQIKDESLDFVYIDAGHAYMECKLDIDGWYPKVKDGGILAGHDYFNCAGVKQAVDEFVGLRNYDLKTFDAFGPSDNVRYGEWLVVNAS